MTAASDLRIELDGKTEAADTPGSKLLRRTFMPNRTILVALSVSLLVGACADPTSDTTTTPPATATTTIAPPATTSTTVPPIEIPPKIDWENPDNPVSVGVGWTVARCEGDAPLLCVARDGGLVGTVEWFISDPHTYEVYDPSRHDEANLQAMAADFMDSFTVDRAAGCGAEYVVEAIQPELIELRDGTGLVHGFRGTNSDGTPSELHLQYRAFSEGRLILLAASAYDEGGCPGTDGLVPFDSAGLEAFRAHLELLLSLSPLPGGSAESG